MKESKWRKSKSEGEVTKIGLSGFGYQNVSFFENTEISSKVSDLLYLGKI
jgi:hypothetical protein